ncbi:MAG: AAA family ATPase, partial [Bacilli bacterium]|nr:AAA family ATPase [Bacilli bacterium]
MEEVKQRILEYIAIKKNARNIKAPILCLVGPPGVGKTTLGISISQSLNKEFYKISVGGLNDSTELTGHKRTYLGSSPGKIIQGLKKCGTANPVMLIDEVDKIISDFKGDPAAVLLDILDPNQNKHFTDNYIEEPFDLSKVLFILTANDIQS